jgi:hypothetical protein
MPNTKRSSSSAAKRREQVRQDRQQRQQKQQKQQQQQRVTGGSQGAKPQSHQRKGARRRSSLMGSWGLVVGVLIVIAAIVVIFVVVSNQQASNNAAQTPTPVSSSVLNAVTHVDPKVLATVGTGGVSNPLQIVKGSPSPLTGPGGHPEFFYYGAEFCPYCAAERWAVVVALSRFGTFTKLGQIQSSEDSISTFTFRQSAYSSQYIDFVPVEEEGQNHELLQTPTTGQQQLINTYDAPPYSSTAGGYPFIDIANQRVMSGASDDPSKLLNLTWDDIAGKLSDSNSDVAKAILGSANYLTAAICLATNQQPGSVCNASFIQQIEQALGKTTALTSPVAVQFQTVIRRPD